ncbi:Lrp/AsnC family transcriptional regulator [Antarctobacter heliothermus]|uniref:Lrp/AsnC family transcriptional regulator n=1 Tax=Antarctobacter heliothermus TaxID=74033 RepID=A0A239IYK5_9RHOB|nr:Lrp/AsnC family transcriptional regulator [Antarctobacter heliothermus]SNS98701.1 Lrp/AsnC family transcriptional regulator [Antarctobacter heliothermus]
MTDLVQISDLDRRILAVLQKDASGSMQDLADAVNSSSATCWRRLRNLEENGVIGPPVRHVTPAAVGLGMDAFVQVRMKSQDSRARAEFQRTTETVPAITEVYSISGEWDYLLHLVVRDIADLESILMRHVLEHPNVAGTATMFVLRRIKQGTELPLAP